MRTLVLAPWMLTLSVLTLGGCGDAYPPPLLASTSAPRIRIRLGGERAKATLRISKQAWEIRSAGGAAHAVRGHTDLATVLRVGARGIEIRGHDTGASKLRIKADASFQLDDRSYSGLLIVTRKQGKLEFVNELDMETYLAGVIPNEVGPNAEPATYRAQAVTARTYAWMRINRSGAGQRSFHVYDNARSQVYTGLTIPAAYKIDYHSMVERVADTRGVVLTIRGRPFATYYSSTCGGHTTQPHVSGLDAGTGAAEPLNGVPCTHCSTSKYYRWKKVLSEAEIVRALRAAKRPISGPIHSIAISRKGRGGWAAEVKIVYGTKRSVRTLPGWSFRSALKLRSHNLSSISFTRGAWRISGRGWGHGVGMCQWGAIELGRKGASETEILRYYYPGVNFTKVY